MGLENSHCNRLIFSTSCHKRPAHYSSGTLVFLDKVLSFRAFFSVFRGIKFSVSRFFRDLTQMFSNFSHFFTFFSAKIEFLEKVLSFGPKSSQFREVLSFCEFSVLPQTY